MLENEFLEPQKTRVTIRLDTDMLNWFKKLGPQYQTRINRILRLYYQGILSGEISIDELVREEQPKMEDYKEEMARLRAENDRHDRHRW